MCQNRKIEKYGNIKTNENVLHSYDKREKDE